MLKRILTVFAFLWLSSLALAQTQNLGQPVSWNGKLLHVKKSVEMPAVDNSAEIAAEYQRRSNSLEKFYKFGHEELVNINIMTEAETETLPNGNVLRRLRVKSPGAVSLNLIFGQFELAKGARLYISDYNKTAYIGAHTSLNNNSSKMLGTDLLYSDDIVIELLEPADVAGTSTLVLSNVIHGFLNLEDEAAKSLNQSGSCEYDVNCPIGAGWENQRNAVAMLVSGSGFCSGSLINNASGTVIPYLLTANHCGTTPGSWVYRFRWERPAATVSCGSNSTTAGGPQTMNINGGVTKASTATSDFHLILLNTAPDPAWGIYYNGWNRTDVASNGATGIHHPAGDIKKISFEYSTLESATFGACPPNSHWKCPSWDEGVTEGGSSGSPLFDVNHRTIGQLHGGASACGGSDLSDEYGKIAVSWEGDGTSTTRLRDWLDPDGTAGDYIDGTDPSGPAATNDAGMGAVTGANGTLCSASTITPTVTISNGGTATLTSATILYHIDSQADQAYNWTGSLAQYGNEVVTLPTMTVPGGAHTFTATVSNPNGNTDEVSSNNVSASSFTIISNPAYADLTLVLDCYGSETSWALTAQGSSTALYSGSGYVNNSSGQTISQQFCLAAGCYTFRLNDEYGDGFGGDNGCDDGYYYITGNGDTLAQIEQADADYGSTNAQNFCVTASGLGLSEIDSHAWSLYPNPSKGFATIDLSGLNAESVIVQSVTGDIIDKFDQASGKLSLNTSNYAKGVYVISVVTKSGLSNKRLIVQ